MFIHETSYQEHLHDLSQFQEILYCHCYKVSVGRMKKCDRCHNWFHKVCNDFKSFAVTAYFPVPSNSLLAY